MMRKCALCGRFLLPSETAYESALYGATRAMILHEKCTLEEDAAITAAGGTNIPNLLEEYMFNLKLRKPIIACG